jgi:mannose-6-phosphate isomerase
MNTVLTFRPIPMERVWGGRELEKRYSKPLPPGIPIGETWEVVDREEAQSIIEGGDWAGHSLHDLWMQHREGIFGEVYGGHPAERFPILIKLLDARETLSVQVHPPVHLAAHLQGEPKTEMWYFLDTDLGACIYAGVVPGITRERFAELLKQGRVEEAINRLPVHKGESIFIPSGRLHAIGAGTIIAEIQQNSDTTYRVFDWNRVGLDGKPRELHVEKSLESIDFEDTNPKIQQAGISVVASCPYFHVEYRKGTDLPEILSERFVILAVLVGNLKADGRIFAAGSFVLLPAGYSRGITGSPDLEVLHISLPTEF